MDISPTLRELLSENQLLTLLIELISQYNIPVWLEDEQGEVVLGQKRTEIAFSIPIALVEEQTIGIIKGSQVNTVIPNLITYLLSQQMLVLFDELTKIPNRRYGGYFLEQEWKRSVREQLTLSIILTDIDHFKMYNDYYGHLRGDQCLRQVAQIFSRTIKRPMDMAARYGGEEFLIILPNTELEGAEVVANSIRNQIVEQCIPHHLSPVSPYLTVSMGIASTMPQLNQSVKSLILRADQALYRAKAMGRNQYCVG